MAGTIEGGRKAAETNKRKYGKEHYARIGAMGGKKGVTGGFATLIPCNCNVIAGQHYIKQCAGVRGGTTSKRRPRETR